MLFKKTSSFVVFIMENVFKKLVFISKLIELNENLVNYGSATVRIVSASVLLCLTSGEPLHTNAFCKIVLILRVHIADR